jgi:hypothetical protein
LFARAGDTAIEEEAPERARGNLPSLASLWGVSCARIPARTATSTPGSSGRVVLGLKLLTGQLALKASLRATRCSAGERVIGDMEIEIACEDTMIDANFRMPDGKVPTTTSPSPTEDA